MPRTSKYKIKHELVKRGGKIRVRKFSRRGYDHFSLRIYVEGDLHQLEYVEYELHPTFKNPTRLEYQRKGGFPLTIWTWGEFEIPVTLRFIDGHVEQLMHELRYSDLLPPDNSAYVDETPAELRGA